jgi:hypothetical protein
MRRVWHDRDVPTPFLLMFLAFGAFALWSATRTDWWRVALRLQSTPRHAIGALGEGVAAKIVGTVRPIQVMLAPITGRRCVYWRVIVSEYQSSRDMDGNDTSGWSQILDQRNGLPFLVVDGSGRALVDPAHAEVALVADAESEGGERLQMFLLRYGISPRRNVRYTEAVIEPGEVVAVAGAGVREPDPEGTGGAYREAPTRLRIAASPSVPLLISDRPDTTE